MPWCLLCWCSGKQTEALHVVEGLLSATVCWLAAQVTSVVLSLLHEGCHCRLLQTVL